MDIEDKIRNKLCELAKLKKLTNSYLLQSDEADNNNNSFIAVT